MQCGQDVVDAVRRIEERATKVVATSFKCLEQFRDPEDFREFTSVLLADPGKCNVAAMKSLAKDIMMRRWWKWVLCHPLLDEQHIHPERSVSHVHAFPPHVHGFSSEGLGHAIT